MAITASFIPSSGVLSVFGDSLDDIIKLSRNAAGQILVNGGAITVIGGTPTVANTTLMQVFGQAGNDTITLDESNGALPPANLFGGAGNDVVTGGSGGDKLFGQTGNDTLLGKGGNDLLFGGDGDDTLTGGDGDDQVFGEAGNDRMIWNPGDDSDLFEGGDGTDTAEVNGGNGAETFTITPNGTRVRFDRVTPAPFFLDIGTTEEIVVNANGGDDVITASNGLSGLIRLTIDGGTGNDTITGGDGNDRLLGGDGNDTVTGGRGSDTALLGAGDDTFIWNPGDGNDVVDGQDGTDKLLFNGANIAEFMDLSANGGRAKFTRNVANIVMDLDNIENVQVNALGGADQIMVNNLAATDVKQVSIDLGTADGAADQVIVAGTNGADQITVAGVGSSVAVTGLSAQVNADHTEAGDLLVINAGNGNDTINAAGLAAGVIGLTIDGGAGNDAIVGSQGRDTILGGDGNDTVTGGRGDDVALLGAGSDTFIWNPGDGNDVVEGQAGTDTLLFNGANIAEKIDISANGARTLFRRDVANITMDLNEVENVDFNALGGADNITVGDLTGTAVKQVNIDLSATPGSGQGDGAADSVVVNGTQAADAITVASSGTSVVVSGLPAKVTVTGSEGADDSLTINGQGGDDTINVSGLNAGQVKLTINGGLGNDTITGSKGDDVVNGGDGNDTARLGLGNDTFVWNPGDDNDIVDGQGGSDTLLFNGANIAEAIDISDNGGHAKFTRNVAAVTMDLDNVETIDFRALGGADTITVNDMTKTDVGNVKLDLGGADGQVDTVVLNATNGDDVVTVTNNNGVITVKGLGTDVTITGFEATDRLVINGLGGNDVIEATKLSGMLLTANGGDGDDVLIGSAGNDTLAGGAGDDVLIGGPGQDVLDGGPGSNVVIQSLLGQFMASSFVPSGLGQVVQSMMDAASSQTPTLAQPHA
ncbi:MAG: calcium-binding protein [Reyranellaceae bacterium]